MFCKECGKSIDDDSKYCRYCGTFQNNHGPDSPSDNFQSSDVYVTTPPYTEPRVSDSKESEKKPSPNRKYDESYKKEIDATVVGGLILLVNTILLATGVYADWADSADDTFFLTLSLVNLIWRIWATMWIVSIAKRQNRNTTGWGIFAFIIPNLALLIIGTLRKLLVKNLPFNATHEDLANNPESPQEIEKRRLMEKYNISFEDGLYVFQTYRFTLLSQALSYAEKSEANKY